MSHLKEYPLARSSVAISHQPRETKTPFSYYSRESNALSRILSLLPLKLHPHKSESKDYLLYVQTIDTAETAASLRAIEHERSVQFFFMPQCHATGIYSARNLSQRSTFHILHIYSELLMHICSD